MSAIDELLQQAIAQARAGNKPGAKKILAQVVKQEPRNARVWYLLSQVVDNKEQSVYCLNKVLEIEPGNTQATKRLQAIRGETVESPRPQPQKQQGVPESKPAKKNSWVRVVLAVGGSFVFVCCILSVIVLLDNDNEKLALVSTETPADFEAQSTDALTQQTAISATNTEIPAAPILSSLTPILIVGAGDGRPACISPDAPLEVGLVTSIVDGDTIHALINGQDYSVRYIGIDAPEINQNEAYSIEATAKNRELVENRAIILVKDVSDTDRYGRLLRYVFIDDVAGLFVNYELVRLGYAYAVTYQPDSSCSDYFETAQQIAQNSLAGFWGDFSSRSLTAIPSLTPLSTTASGGGTAPCNCTGQDLNCPDFSSHAAAQRCFDYCKSKGYGDVFRLDRDSDGLACEDLP